MSAMPVGEITSLLMATRSGRPDALDRLLTLLYPTFRAIAGNMLQAERRNHTLQPTALVNEALAKLFLQDESAEIENRAHLMALAARQMRRVLIDYARTRTRQRRGGGIAMVGEENLELPSPLDLESLVLLDDLLNELSEVDERAAQVFELRYFAGLSREEIASRLTINVRTVQRDWDFARAWLADCLKRG